MDNASQDSRVSYDDEISISELLLKLWRKRGLIVLMPLLLAGLTVTALLATKVTSPERLSYYIELTGLKDNAYPNGTAFSPQDLLNPQVVAELANAFAIKDSEAIGKRVQVEFGTPLSDGILTEYRAVLRANSKGSAEDIALINERYQTRLEAAARRGLRIVVNYSGLGLTKAQGTELAYALPRVWNEVFSTRFRIFIDSGIASLPTVRNDVDITSTVGALEGELQLRAIQEGIVMLKDDARFRALQVEGVSPADLEKMINDFERIYFDPIYSGSFKDNDGLSAIYRRDLELELIEIDASLIELDNRIGSITELQLTATKSEANSSNLNSGTSQIQIEGDALNQLVDLSRTASLAEYLQGSFDERFELIKKRATITTRLAKMNNKTGVTLTTEFYEQAINGLRAISDHYIALREESHVAAKKQAPTLYAATSVVAGEKRLERDDFLLIALALAFGGMIAVFTAILGSRGTVN